MSATHGLSGASIVSLVLTAVTHDTRVLTASARKATALKTAALKTGRSLAAGLAQARGGAMDFPRLRAHLADTARELTWQREAEKVVELYRKVLKR